MGLTCSCFISEIPININMFPESLYSRDTAYFLINLINGDNYINYMETQNLTFMSNISSLNFISCTFT